MTEGSPGVVGRTVLVLQGGGALGAYQAGVYEALHESGVEPDWVIGTSIGAINAALIVGNRPDDRLARLREFWDTVSAPSGYASMLFPLAPAIASAAAANAVWGLPGFFRPNLDMFLDARGAASADRASWYDTRPLRATLDRLVDPNCLASPPIRLSVGAVNVRTGAMHYFDSASAGLGIRHIMASGALPPAFGAVEIDGEYYWDGGIYSNTPIELVMDELPRRDSLIFAVNLWKPAGDLPSNVHGVLGRMKDIRFSSRAASHIARLAEAHRLRHVLSELADHIPAEQRAQPHVKALLDAGCTSQMRIVSLQSPREDDVAALGDIDFRREAVRRRWDCGLQATRRALRAAPWREPLESCVGVAVHDID